MRGNNISSMYRDMYFGCMICILAHQFHRLFDITLILCITYYIHIIVQRKTVKSKELSCRVPRLWLDNCGSRVKDLLRQQVKENYT